MFSSCVLILLNRTIKLEYEFLLHAVYEQDYYFRKIELLK